MFVWDVGLIFPTDTCRWKNNCNNGNPLWLQVMSSGLIESMEKQTAEFSIWSIVNSDQESMSDYQCCYSYSSARLVIIISRVKTVKLTSYMYLSSQTYQLLIVIVQCTQTMVCSKVLARDLSIHLLDRQIALQMGRSNGFHRHNSLKVGFLVGRVVLKFCLSPWDFADLIKRKHSENSFNNIPFRLPRWLSCVSTIIHADITNLNTCLKRG